MSTINWRDLVNWNEETYEELRIAGYSYIRQGKYAIALSLFETLALLCPDSVYDLQTIGAIHVELNQPAKALRYLDRALKLDPKEPNTLLNLAKALVMLGNVQEGLKVAQLLKHDGDPHTQRLAEALIMAFTPQ